MNTLQNLHTHTTFGDGVNTPEELINIAIEKGFSSLGFSEHSPMFYLPDRGMPEKNLPLYLAEIKRLREKYADTLKVYLGLEFDMYSKMDLDGFDYIIASIHNLKIGDGHFDFNRSPDVFKDIINEHFSASPILFLEEYFKEMSTLYKYGDFDIIGHFDLPTKNNGKETIFDENDKKYLSFAVEAMESLRGKIPFFEVNTGVMARGSRKTPYPSMTLLKEFYERGFGAVITSDCHVGKNLDFGFDIATEMLKEAGFKEKYILFDDGFHAVEL